MGSQQPLTSTPAQPKRLLPSSFPSTRRTSTSAIPNASSPTNTPPKNSPNTSSTNIPTFRSLRSLLPFGPNKHATPISSTVSPSPHVSRGPFAHFGSVRRSINRERKVSLDVELPPVISIDLRSKDEVEEPSVRRSASCSRLEKPLPVEPQVFNEEPPDPFHDTDETVVFSSRHVPVLRTPSPGPPISADLSTILEADTSGISKHIPSSDTFRAPSLSPSLSLDEPHSSPGLDVDTSAPDLSSTQLANQVLDAMMLNDSNIAKQWLNSNKAVIIDSDFSPEEDATFNLDALDSDLAAFLSPHRLPSTKRKNLTISPQCLSHNLTSLDVSKHSPSSPQFALSPSPNPKFTESNVLGSASPLSSLHSHLPRPQSSLPRLRPPPSPAQNYSPSSTMPASSASDSTSPDDDATARIGLPRRSPRHAPPSPIISSGSPSSAPASPAAAAFSTNAPKLTISPSPTSASTSFLSRHFSQTRHSKAPTIVPPAPSSSTEMASLPTSTLSRLKSPFTQTTKALHRPSLVHTAISLNRSADPLHSSSNHSPPPSRLGIRPSLDSTTRSNSPDPPRPLRSPSGRHSECETPARPSVDILRGGGNIDNGESASSGPKSNVRPSAVLTRARNRSMSVQERLGRHILRPGRRGLEVENNCDHEFESELDIDNFAEHRPSSSPSGQTDTRWDGSSTGSGGHGRAPITEWLGPRTVKAFKAAGLLDYERDQHGRTSPGSVPGLGSSINAGHGRFASIRGSSDYNPRAPSRMALSEAGGSSVSRRRSGSGSGIGPPYGLMESPTFTGSTGSRDRDTPRSASTAPTSVSGSSFAYLGRERDRDREELRELKEKHATEMGALLGALSDSQRTTRVLREENGELRERLEQVEAENGALRRVVGDITKETGELKVQLQLLRSGASAGSSRLEVNTWSVPVRRSGLSTPIKYDDDDEWESPVLSTGLGRPDGTNPPQGNTRQPPFVGGEEPDDEMESTLSPVGPMFSSTPAVSRHVRRPSTTSSIFPIPPANMTMLLYDHDNDSVGSVDNTSRFSPSTPMPMPLLDSDGEAPSTPVASTTSISPTTANFSMTTGSPGSLFLRPEHETHLGDMDSLYLGAERDIDIALDSGWSD